jgi:DNA invertase Pin-like site-specific DNA recombinase
MIFGYARVSKRDQNMDLQIDALQKYGVDELFTEKITSRINDRPQLTACLNKLRDGDTLVVWRLDRLGRTTKQLILLMEDFKNKGIDFVSLSDDIDTTTAAGRFMFNVSCAFTQMERDIIVERTIAGLEAAKARGRIGGRKPSDPKAVEKALRMYRTNEFTLREISDATGLAKPTIFKYVASDREAGRKR